MNTSVRVDTAPRPHPGWATIAGLVGITLPRGPAAERPDTATDRLLIAERVARYGWAFDERDRDALADCFTADASWCGSVMGETDLNSLQGAEDIATGLAALWPKQGDQRRHVFTNHVIKLSGNEATAHAYLLLVRARAAVTSLACSGAYRFHLRREADGLWRIDRLTSALDGLISS